jgi:hypothetical protein
VRIIAFLIMCTGLLALQLGCSQTLEKPVDPAQASEVVKTAFDAWKEGESYGSLKERQPPLYFNEPEWESGKKLMSYEAGPVTLTGRQGRCSVKVKLQDKTGKVTERTIGYQVETTPAQVITREALGP